MPVLPASSPPQLPPSRWLEAAADQLATPMLLLEADGRLVHANRAAREWLAARPRMTLDGAGALVPAAASARPAWRRLLARAAAPMPPRRDARRPVTVALLPGWRLHRLATAEAGAAPRLVLMRPLPEGE